MGYLILVRHGQSRWNLTNKFTGWVDVPLSSLGIREALKNARELENVEFDEAFTSELTRAQETLLLIFSDQDRTGIFLHENEKMKNWRWYRTKLDKKEIPIYSSVALNERYYGKLQGLDKSETRKRFGESLVLKWRRSFVAKPPGGESLEDVYRRAVPYFKKKIVASLNRGKNVIVSAHGNSLRAIIKYIENVSEKNIAHLELPNGEPVIYKYRKGKFFRQTREFSYNRPVLWKEH